MELLKAFGRRGLIVIGLIVLIFMVMDFNNRMAELTRLEAEHGSESERLSSLQATEAVLQARLAYATSDAAVEEWAREDGRYILPGDFPIQPQVAGDPIIESEEVVLATPQPLSKWEAWQELFFSSDP